MGLVAETFHVPTTDISNLLPCYVSYWKIYIARSFPLIPIYN